MARKHNRSETEEEKSYTSVNRRKFVKALGVTGSAAVTGSVFSSTAQAASPEHPSSEEREFLSGDELNQLSRTTAGREDVVNLMSTTWQNSIQSGKFNAQEENSEYNSHEITTSGDNTTVSGAKHKLSNGNGMTAVQYQIDDGKVLVYYEYDSMEDGVKEKAEIWKVTEGEEFEITLEEASYNGAPIRFVTDETSSENPELAQSNGPCSGCNYPIAPNDPNPGRELKNVCTSASSSNCPAYVFSCGACGACSPINAGCVGCALIACPQVITRCCGRNNSCVQCREGVR